MANLETISGAINKYGMTARQTGDTVAVYDKKGRLAGTVDNAGKIDRKYDGRQALMSALVRDAIRSAITEAK